MVIKLCCVAAVTAVCALILKSQKPDFVPLCITAGGIILLIFAFDYFADGMEFLKTLTQTTGVEPSAVRLVLKVIGVGYIIELTAGSVKDMGFEGLADKLVLCGKFIIFAMALPLLRAMFEMIVALAGAV